MNVYVYFLHVLHFSGKEYERNLFFNEKYIICKNKIKFRQRNFIIHKRNMSSIIDNDFLYWLAGLIDGDGSLLVNKNKALTCEITVHERDVKALFKIKAIYHGSVLKRSNVKAYR
jgi:hypothetical protein